MDAGTKTLQTEYHDMEMVGLSAALVENLTKLGNKLKEMGIEVIGSEIVMKCKQPTKLNSEDEVAKVMDLIDGLEEHDDIVNVFSGFEYNV